MPTTSQATAALNIRALNALLHSKSDQFVAPAFFGGRDTTTGAEAGSMNGVADERTTEEEEWLARGLGLADALRQLRELAEERDGAETLLLDAQSRLEAEMDRCKNTESELVQAREAVKSYERRIAAQHETLDVEPRPTVEALPRLQREDANQSTGAGRGMKMKKNLHRLSSAIRRRRPRCSGSTVAVFLTICLVFTYDAIRLGLRIGETNNMMRGQEHLAFGPMIDDRANPSSLTKVLIVRTVSPSEIPIVIDDVVYVKSFYRGKHESLMQKSRKYCNTLREAGYAAKLDPLVNGTHTFPNHLLCNSEEGRTENYYASVRADFMLFARSDAYVQQIMESIDAEAHQFQGNSFHDVDVDVKDVSSNPKKIWNWIAHCDEDRLAGYDYVWFIDGDITLKSLNFQAFWQQVMLLRPKITQASVVGDGTEHQYGSTHTILRYHADSRLIAGYVPMIEVQSPLLEVKTWLDYRRFVVNDPEPMPLIGEGAEACFDMAWCHLAINNLTGTQEAGQISRIGYKELSPTVSLDEGSNAGIQGRGCVVLYQTPIVHITKHTIVTGERFVQASRLLCSYFRLKVGAIHKKGLGTVYELFSAPKI